MRAVDVPARTPGCDVVEMFCVCVRVSLSFASDAGGRSTVFNLFCQQVHHGEPPRISQWMMP